MPKLKTVLYVAAGIAIAIGAGCANEAPTDPNALPAAAAGRNPGAVDHVPNDAPNLVLKTRPPLDTSTVPASLFGEAPLTVNFNLCESTDPNQDPDSLPTAGEGDTLNWQFHWGDDGTLAWKPDGSFNPSYEGFCRMEHEYAVGVFTATLSVTDKHLDDQSNDVTASARTTLQVTVNSVTLPVGNTSNSIESVRTPS
jgi:hypothetical protein